jgi:polyhydroxyalkanoate synthase
MGLLNFWMRDTLDENTIDPSLMVQAFGNIPGDFINLGFLMLKPFELGLQKYLNLIESPDKSKQMMNFLRLEKWIFDNPDQIGETWRQYIEDFYMHNRLIAGEVILDGQQVDLSKLTMPILNIYAEQDHLVPPASTTVLKNYVSSDDYTEAAFPVGHVGIYVSSRVQEVLPQLLHNWLSERA